MDTVGIPWESAEVYDLEGHAIGEAHKLVLRSLKMTFLITNAVAAEEEQGRWLLGWFIWPKRHLIRYADTFDEAKHFVEQTIAEHMVKTGQKKQKSRDP